MRRALCLVLLVGCGDDGGSVQKDAAAGDGMMIDGQLVDAPRPVDAGIDAQQFVLSVTCPGGTLPTITSTDGELFYTPNSVTIAQNDIVKFVTSATHDVVPNTTNSDPGLRVAKNETRCLQFTITGTLGFHCGPHGFQGTIVVN